MVLWITIDRLRFFFFVNLLNDYNQEINSLDENDKWYHQIFYHIMNDFKAMFEYKAALMKSPCFKAENEFRVIINPSVFCWADSFKLDGDDEPFKIEQPVKLYYKESNGTLIPYLKVPLDLNKLISIMPSPYMDHNQSCLGLEDYAKTNFMSFSVERSQIPFLERKFG